MGPLQWTIFKLMVSSNHIILNCIKKKKSGTTLSSAEFRLRNYTLDQWNRLLCRREVTSYNANDLSDKMSESLIILVSQLELRSGPKNQARPDPSLCTLCPSPAWPINCNYEPDLFFNTWAVINDVLNYNSMLFEPQKYV